MNEQPTLPERVCKTLEGITALDGDDTPLAQMVYRFCHIARGKCGNLHKNWVEEFEKMEAAILAECASPAAKRKKEWPFP